SSSDCSGLRPRFVCCPSMHVEKRTALEGLAAFVADELGDHLDPRYVVCQIPGRIRRGALEAGVEDLTDVGAAAGPARVDTLGATGVRLRRHRAGLRKL